jgi:hypothetical protein
MPHFSASWYRMVATICPKWLEELVNEEEGEDPGLDVEMSLRSMEDLPLPPLPPELVPLEEEGIKDLTAEEISAIEAQLDGLNVSEGSESELEAGLDNDYSLIPGTLWGCL